jgi:phosphoribosylformimino-5-aminoimidazole carboxamide ribonucleotide (ProFAR) isomerase
LEAAIAESLKTSTTSSSPAACALPAEVTTATTDLLTHQSAVTEHSRKEADAVHIAVDSVHHRLEDLISLNGEEEQCMKEMLEDEEKKTATAAEKAVATAAVQEGLVNEPAVDEEQQLEEYLEQLRAQSARLSGNK